MTLAPGIFDDWFVKLAMYSATEGRKGGSGTE
jgi:hypothetical protein